MADRIILNKVDLLTENLAACIISYTCVYLYIYKHISKRVNPNPTDGNGRQNHLEQGGLTRRESRRLYNYNYKDYSYVKKGDRDDP